LNEDTVEQQVAREKAPRCGSSFAAVQEVTDDLRHAWAVLRLRPGSPVEAAHSAYRRLARQWHPDRYGHDPQGQATAAIQMRVLNGAYRRVLEAARAGFGAPPVPSVSTGRRLSREEIDHFIATMGSKSWLDELLQEGSYWDSFDWLAYSTPADQWRVTPFVAVGLIVALALLLEIGFASSGVAISAPVRTCVMYGLGFALLAVVHFIPWTRPRDRDDRDSHRPSH
jgi:hypothetical protein